MWRNVFLDFQYGFRSSWSTANLRTVVSDVIARAFNRSGATWAVALDISKTFDRVWHAGVLQKRKSFMEFQVRYLAFFLLFSVIDGFEWFRITSFHKNIQLMLEFLKAPFLGLLFSYSPLMTFMIMLSVILLSMLIMLLSALSVIRQWCNLTFSRRFWATKVCLRASKISKICLFGCPTGWATSWKANFENYSRYSLIKWYQFL